MASWTIHLPPDGARGPGAIDRFVVVKDGVRPLAILFGPLWLLFKRLWIAALIVIALEAALIAVCWALAFPMIATRVLVGVLHGLIGLEASSLQRWTLARNGWREIGAIVAHGRREAELRAAMLAADAADASARTPAPGPTRAAARPPSPAPSGVLGLFPDPRSP
jgi:hypothetical protein